MKMTDAEKAYEVAVARKDTGSPREAFVAGRISRDAEVAELSEQLAEAQATIEKVRAWAETYAYGDGDYYRGVDSAQETVKELLSAPSSTGGDDE